MEVLYCWRAKEFLPMLDENEWAEMSPYLQSTIQRIKEYRKTHNCDIATARLNCSHEAVLKFEQLTGKKDIHYDLIFKLRRSNYGAECEYCDKILRTPKAKYCVECGNEK